MTDQPTEAEILRVARQYKAALARKDAQALARLTRAYTQMYARLKDKIELLVDIIGTEQPTAGQIVRMRRYLDLIEQIEQELTGYQIIIRNELDNAARLGISLGTRDAQQLMRLAAGQAGITARFNALPSATIKQLLGFLADDSPLYTRLSKLAGTYADEVRNAIVEGVGLGYNPRKIANLIRDKLGGGLTDALRMTRTSQLWSYREASRANYILNSDVVSGWVWYAELDNVVCPACAALHGTFHTSDENLDGHYNCRCAMIPVLVGEGSPVTQTGEDWFKGLSEQQQSDFLGKSKYEALKEGKFEWSALARQTEDAVYGHMHTETPLYVLLGEDAP